MKICAGSKLGGGLFFFIEFVIMKLEICSNSNIYYKEACDFILWKILKLEHITPVKRSQNVLHYVIKWTPMYLKCMPMY